MRILITGAGGFVGGHLVRAAAAEGSTTIGVTRDGHVPGADESLAADLLDPRAAADAVAAAAPDAVVHLAARASVAESWRSPAETLRDNVLMTHHVLAAVRDRTPEARVLVAGSGEQYGAPPPSALPLTEDEPPRPRSPYALSKASSELVAGFFADGHGLSVVRTRAFNHAGPGQADSYVISALARRVAEAELASPAGDAVIGVGNTEAGRDFTDVRDVVRAYLMALRSAEPAVYNVCSGTATTIAAVIDRLRSMTHLTIEARTDPSLLRPQDAPEVRGSAARLAAATGWAPTIPLERTIEDTLDWWRAELRS